MNPDPQGHGRRYVLVVATGRYRHKELRDLDSPPKDADVLQTVLGNPELGGFKVDVLNDTTSDQLRKSIYEFCASDVIEPDDFRVLYFSCHGLKDADGTAYLATIDTDPADFRGVQYPPDISLSSSADAGLNVS